MTKRWRFQCSPFSRWRLGIRVQHDARRQTRIIVFDAHPDDSEYRGVSMKWAKQGHHVKLVATTNGDIGHWRPPADRCVAAQGGRGNREAISRSQ